MHFLPAEEFLVVYLGYVYTAGVVLAGVAESGSGDLGVESVNDCWLKISKLIMNTAKQ